MLSNILTIILSYLFGAIPTGLIVSRAYGVDIAKMGSGNVGSTNVARTLGKLPGAIVLFLDFLKGYLPAVIVAYLTDSPFIAGAAAVFGHCFSIPPLRGGKGVATSLGMLLGTIPSIGFIAIFVFFVTFALTRMVSASSIASATTVILSATICSNTTSMHIEVLPLVLASLIVIYRHHKNIERILKGEEKAFSFAK